MALAASVFLVAIPAFWRRVGPRGAALVLVLILGLYGLGKGAARTNLPQLPGSTPSTPWRDVQVWARMYTATDSLFITPPHLTGFRLESERSQFASWKDGTYGILSKPFARKWWARISALCNPPLTTETEAKKVCSSNYRQLTPERIEALARRWPVTHIVVVAPQALPWPALYTKNGFRLYAIPRPASAEPPLRD